MILYDHLQINDAGHLTIGGLDTVELAKEFGTPSFVFDESALAARMREIKRIVDESYDKAKAIIMEHEYVLHKCCDLLIEREKIGQEEFEALFEK